MANQPDVGDVHVNSLLTGMSIAYYQEEQNFIADEVFPLIGVDHQTDLYPVYGHDAWFRDHGDRMRRAPGTKAARTGWDFAEPQTFRCLNEAIGTAIPDELRANADANFNLDADATRLVTNSQLIRRERMFFNDFMKTGVWTTDKSGGSDFVKWSDYANSDPFGDIDTYRNTMRGLIGREPNKMIMGELAWRRLKQHPDFLDRIKGGATPGNPALMTLTQLAGFIEIPRILISKAMYNTAAEGQTPVLADIASNDDVLLLYAPDSPSIMSPAAGYTFYWKPMSGGGIQYIRKYREEPERQDVIESYSYFDQVVTAPNAGIFLNDTVD